MNFRYSGTQNNIKRMFVYETIMKGVGICMQRYYNSLYIVYTLLCRNVTLKHVDPDLIWVQICINYLSLSLSQLTYLTIHLPSQSTYLCSLHKCVKQLTTESLSQTALVTM